MTNSAPSSPPQRTRRPTAKTPAASPPKSDVVAHPRQRPQPRPPLFKRPTLPKLPNLPSLPVNWMQVGIVVAIVLGIMFVIDLGNRIQMSQRIIAESQLLVVQVQALETEQALLYEELEYVHSDDYVVQWAHSEGRFVRPGEVLVIPVLPEGNQRPISVEPLPPPPPPIEVWELWYALFFGS